MHESYGVYEMVTRIGTYMHVYESFLPTDIHLELLDLVITPTIDKSKYQCYFEQILRGQTCLRFESPYK
jgi:hypothetical protein